MKSAFLLISVFFGSYFLQAQINPQNSPYYADGIHTVVADSDLTSISVPLLFYHPQTPGNYPVFMFQLGANGFGSNEINRHTYDIYMNHLASYGYVVIILDASQAGFPDGAYFIEAHDWFKSEVANTNHWLNSYADSNKVVIGGHSNGGVNASALLVDRPTEIDGIVFMDSYPSDGILGIGAHDVSGYSGKVLTLGADEYDPTSNKSGWDKFTSSSCKTYVNILGMDHGGFGDYNLASQPVGPIGREDATATVRHFFVSWMLSEFKADVQASSQLVTLSLHPNTVGEFVNDCGIFTSNIEITESNQFQFYPNPFKNQLNIINEEGHYITLNVIDATGKTILSKSSKNNKINLETNSLSKGIYLLKLIDSETGNVIKTSKVLKQ